MNNLDFKLISIASFVTYNHSHMSKNEADGKREDKKTPYFTQLISGGFMILNDSNPSSLSFKKRVELCVSFMCRDIIKNTFVTESELRDELNQIFNDDVFVKRVIFNVKECTPLINMTMQEEFQLLKSETEKFSHEYFYGCLINVYMSLMGNTQELSDTGVLNDTVDYLFFLITEVKKTKYKDTAFVTMSEAIATRLYADVISK